MKYQQQIEDRIREGKSFDDVIKKRISALQWELVGAEEYGFNHTINQIEDEIERLQALLTNKE